MALIRMTLDDIKAQAANRSPAPRPGRVIMRPAAQAASWAAAFFVPDANRPDGRMTPRNLSADRRQRDLFDPSRLPMMRCPVCQGKKTVAFWSRQGKAPVIGGKQVPCQTCHGTGRVAARA